MAYVKITESSLPKELPTQFFIVLSFTKRWGIIRYSGTIKIDSVYKT